MREGGRRAAAGKVDTSSGRNGGRSTPGEGWETLEALLTHKARRACAGMHTRTYLQLFMVDTSSKAISRRRQSGKDCPAVHPRLKWHRCYDLPGKPPARGV